MRNITKGLLGAVALTVLVGVPAAKADIAMPTGVWEVFDFGPAGVTSGYWQDLSGSPLTYTFTVVSHAVLTVTDGYFNGDQFDVNINGVNTDTSATSFTGAYEGDNWAAASVNPAFSHSHYSLGAGTYTVTGYAIETPFFGVGAGALLLGVPEPATWAMMLVGFGAVGAAMRKARRTSAAVTA
jgi:hypothetical protein